jgi:heme oxygenase
MVVADAPVALSTTLRIRTAPLHRRAERTGIVADLLRGRATRRGYAIFLRNLHPAYEQLEIALQRLRDRPALSGLAKPEVYRAPDLAADLVSLCGADWPERLPLTSAGEDYAARVVAAAEGSGDRLIGHAYVRYFGDLNGGQILKRRLATSLGLPAESLSFYDFPRIDDMGSFLRSYREALDRSARWIDEEGVVEAAVEAFSLNIALSQAVESLGPCAGGDPA